MGFEYFQTFSSLVWKSKFYEIDTSFVIFAVSRQGPKTAFPARISMKNIYFTHVIVALALLGHQTSHSQNKLFSRCLHNIPSIIILEFRSSWIRHHMKKACCSSVLWLLEPTIWNCVPWNEDFRPNVFRYFMWNFHRLILWVS